MATDVNYLGSVLRDPGNLAGANAARVRVIGYSFQSTTDWTMAYRRERNREPMKMLTLVTYSHVVRSLQEKVVRKMDDLMG